ncbi:MAG: GH3 auxin-responsive promoter family protein [Oscillospiraceae bacterium]
MRFQDKLKKNTKEELWSEYCGFLDLGMDEYMYIQRRLMDEQLRAWENSALGCELLGGAKPASVDEFRNVMPLTSYEDYADTLLSRKSAKLPAEPIIWIQTTWEGGLRPVKLAPYTREMLDAYKHNVIAITMLASGRSKGDFSVRPGDRVLYGGAPLPYATGLLPSLLNEDIDFVWLPDGNADSMSFSQRIKAGFASAMKGGVDYFFAIGSVANYITENFGKVSGSGGKRPPVSLPIAFRYLKAKYNSRKTGVPIVPGDVFHIKGFVCAGTDSKCYKTALTRAWGVVPIEIAAGTESTCVAAETWEQRGMVFFPDACFYEFIPEDEMRRSGIDSARRPRTVLMDEVRAGESYELVISVFHGGAFMRYRIGDMYHCLSSDAGKLPRFTFVDRVPAVIDIAGFTRITESSIEEVISLSKLGIGDWLAKKEFDAKGIPYLRLYVEITPEAQGSDVTKKQVLTEHLSVYFKYFDSDYNDLKKLLGMEPLVITILKYGTISSYQHNTGRTLPRINPETIDVSELQRFQTATDISNGGGIG